MDLRTSLGVIVVLYLALGAGSWLALEHGAQNVAVGLWGVGGLALLGVAGYAFYRRVLENDGPGRSESSR